MNAVPVLEVGGTHVTSAVVDTETWELIGPATRLRLDSAAPAAAIIATLIEAGDAVGARPGSVWGAAWPGPFDYATGVALFRDVGKFESLYGLDLRAALLGGLVGQPGEIAFINDADAFALGEWRNGASTGTARSVGITLGTGVGSGWVSDGRIVDTGPDVPPGGRAHRLMVGGAPLEDFMSRRAIRRAYAAATGDTEADVREICDRARGGQGRAIDTLALALRTLGLALAEPVSRFGAEVVVFGGSMAASWDVLEPLFIEGFTSVAEPPRLAVATDGDRAPLLGAAARAIEVSPPR